MYLVTEPALGADAEAVANDQHPDHQLRVNRGTARVAVERSEMLAQLAEIKEMIDASQQCPWGRGLQG